MRILLLTLLILPRAVAYALPTPKQFVQFESLRRGLASRGGGAKGGTSDQQQQQQQQHEEDERARLAGLVDRLSRFSGAPPVIRTYKMSRRDLYFRFFGTVLQRTWKEVLGSMLVSTAIVVWFRIVAGGQDFLQVADFFSPPQAGSLPYFEQLAALDKMWHYLMTITTFTTTFFLNQAFALWRRIYGISRRIQGRMNDIGLIRTFLIRASYLPYSTTTTTTTTKSPLTRSNAARLARFAQQCRRTPAATADRGAAAGAAA